MNTFNQNSENPVNQNRPKWRQLTKNSEYPVSQNAPKWTQLTKINQNIENQLAKMDQNEQI